MPKEGTVEGWECGAVGSFFSKACHMIGTIVYGGVVVRLGACMTKLPALLPLFSTVHPKYHIALLHAHLGAL